VGFPIIPTGGREKKRDQFPPFEESAVGRKRNKKGERGGGKGKRGGNVAG